MPRQGAGSTTPETWLGVKSNPKYSKNQFFYFSSKFRVRLLYFEKKDPKYSFLDFPAHPLSKLLSEVSLKKVWFSRNCRSGLLDSTLHALLSKNLSNGSLPFHRFLEFNFWREIRKSGKPWRPDSWISGPASKPGKFMHFEARAVHGQKPIRFAYKIEWNFRFYFKNQ